MLGPLAEKAIADCLKHKRAMLKFISANDAGATGSHQTGFYLPINSHELFTVHAPQDGVNRKHEVTITWQDGSRTNSVVTGYGKAKSEYRLTRFGDDFPFLTPDQVGSLFILIPTTKLDFIAYVIDDDDEVENLLSALGVELIDGWGEYDPDGDLKESTEACVKQAFEKFAAKLSKFPSGAKFSVCVWDTLIECVSDFASWSPDRQLMRLVEEEYRLFQLVERKLCDHLIHRDFKNVDDFLKSAGSIMNRRKSRAGRSLENHVERVFQHAGAPFEMRPRQIDGKPDLIVPNEDAYLDDRYPESLIYVVGIKTTCKDRWRQVLNEGTRIETKYLITTQQGISANQLNEMVAANLHLVVPEKLHHLYPADTDMHLTTIEELISEISVAHE